MELERAAPAANPELIVVLEPGAARGDQLRQSVAELETRLKSLGVEFAPIAPLWLADEARGRDLAEGAAAERVARYHRVVAPPHRLPELSELVRNSDGVAGAYISPGVEPPTINTMPPSGPPNAVTPDFTANQVYVDDAPDGIGRGAAWAVDGGKGAGVSIVDIEGDWQMSHEDLGGVVTDIGVAGYTPDADWRNHGTAVVGVVAGRDNGFGITGIAPDASVSVSSILGSATSSEAIIAASLRMNPGDIMLLEMHRPGPRFGYAGRPDQRGYIPIEWWPDDYDAIRYAIARGVIVVEAGGNGGEDLDDNFYDTRDPGFPVDWSNPLRREADRDSGAILVGAGAPPPGTHGADHGPDRSRLFFSNCGSAFDAQGWGREVTTLGYGDLQAGVEDKFYTNEFSGTSSASPIVVGVLACLQGIRLARGGPPLSSVDVRALLRAVGSAQQPLPVGDGRIGSRPDLAALIPLI